MQPASKGDGMRTEYDAELQRLHDSFSPLVKRAKELGFTLNEIKELLSLRLDPETTCGDVKQRAETKIGDIEERMRSLRRMKKALVKLTESCSGRGPVDDCPILEALDMQERNR